MLGKAKNHLQKGFPEIRQWHAENALIFAKYAGFILGRHLYTGEI